MKIKRVINRNRKFINIIIIAVFLILIMMRALGMYYKVVEKQKSEKMLQNMENIKNKEDIEITDDYYTPESNSIERTLISFINYCNSRQIQNAYTMLTDQSKKILFPTIEFFEESYVNNIFSEEREYEFIEKFSLDDKITYQVNLYGEMLSTGDADNYIQEYFTFIKDDNNNYKLNINNFIFSEIQTRETTQNNVKISIKQIDVFKDYEILEFVVTNNTSKNICLNGNKEDKRIYLENSENKKYRALNSEFDNETIVLEPQHSETFRISFYKTYKGENETKYLVLSDIILDYEEYLNSEDKTQYSNRISMSLGY